MTVEFPSTIGAGLHDGPTDFKDNPMNAPILLWLDDERPAPEGWTAVTTVAEAIALCRDHPIEAMSLDHDLGSGQPSGYDLACWLEREVFEGRFRLPKSITIHSQNPTGKAQMRAALYRALEFQEKGETSP